MFATSSLVLSLMACSRPDSTFDWTADSTPPTDDVVDLGVDEVSRAGLSISEVSAAMVDQQWTVVANASLLSRSSEALTVSFGQPSAGYDVVRTCNGSWSYGEFECREGAFVAFPIAYVVETDSGDFGVVGSALMAAYELDDSGVVLMFDAQAAGAPWLDVPERPEYSVELSSEVVAALSAIDPGTWTGSLQVDLGPTHAQLGVDATAASSLVDDVVLAGGFEPPGLFE